MKVSKLVFFSLIALSLLTTYASVRADDAVPGSAPTKHQIHAANAKLERSVRRALDKSMGDTAGIVIVARSGAVTLDGTVTDAPQIAQAGQTAGTVPGVSHVKNNLTLRIAGR
jgi:hyperosmotically inducible periplasmic protein